MSNFVCAKCGVVCVDSDRGYVSGCEHYPPDVKPLRGFGTMLDFETGVARRWFIDPYGTKRWADNEAPVPPNDYLKYPKCGYSAHK
jgi:hypothetical protein